MIKCDCGIPMLEFIGPVNSEILIVGDTPDDDDFSKGMIFTGKRGQVLAGELAAVGIPIQRARLMCINMHKPTDECPGQFINVLKEMKNKKGVLLMGAGVAERFQIGKISELAGMCVSSPYFPKTIGFVMATTLPPTSDLLGEFQLSIQKFAKKLKEVKSD